MEIAVATNFARQSFEAQITGYLNKNCNFITNVYQCILLHLNSIKIYICEDLLLFYFVIFFNSIMSHFISVYI